MEGILTQGKANSKETYSVEISWLHVAEKELKKIAMFYTN